MTLDQEEFFLDHPHTRLLQERVTNRFDGTHPSSQPQRCDCSRATFLSVTVGKLTSSLEPTCPHLYKQHNLNFKMEL